MLIGKGKQKSSFDYDSIAKMCMAKNETGGNICRIRMNALYRLSLPLPASSQALQTFPFHFHSLMTKYHSPAKYNSY
jgi:hypothetical protein